MIHSLYAFTASSSQCMFLLQGYNFLLLLFTSRVGRKVILQFLFPENREIWKFPQCQTEEVSLQVANSQLSHCFCPLLFLVELRVPDSCICREGITSTLERITSFRALLEALVHHFLLHFTVLCTSWDTQIDYFGGGVVEEKRKIQEGN